MSRGPKRTAESAVARCNERFHLVQNRYLVRTRWRIVQVSAITQEVQASLDANVHAVDFAAAKLDQAGLGSRRHRRHADLPGDLPIDHHGQIAKRRSQREVAVVIGEMGAADRSTRVQIDDAIRALEQLRQQVITELIGQQAIGFAGETPVEFEPVRVGASAALQSERIGGRNKQHFPAHRRLLQQSRPQRMQRQRAQRLVADAAGDDRRRRPSPGSGQFMHPNAGRRVIDPRVRDVDIPARGIDHHCSPV